MTSDPTLKIYLLWSLLAYIILLILPFFLERKKKKRIFWKKKEYLLNDTREWVLKIRKSERIYNPNRKFEFIRINIPIEIESEGKATMWAYENEIDYRNHFIESARILTEQKD